MALLFDSITADKPQTHIFIIGVGQYPYLTGGSQETEQSFDGAQSLGQLTSPPISAEAFYNAALALDTGKNWVKPLGSIEVLVSGNEPTAFGGKAVAAATLANIQDAYWEWKKRCDTHADNVAIFYFCGHGLEKDVQYLLAEDFGKRVGNPWEHSFVFDDTRKAFFGCKAKTQLFFVDACRNITRDMMKFSLPSTPIEPPNFTTSNCQYDLTQKASAINESAYGRPNDVSFYTSALIKALKSTAARLNEQSEWAVSTGTLSSEMNKLIGMEAPGQGYPQRCISNTSDVTEVVRFHSPPDVQVNISCDPDLALPHADLACNEVNTGAKQNRAPMAAPWSLNVAAGYYSMEANFAAGNYKNTKTVTAVVPPMVNKALKCQ